MKLIIDISDEEYKHIVNPSDQEKTLYHGRWFDMIRSGIPLPKGHGRLIDADALNFNADYNEPLISKLDFDQAPTIIEADKEEEE